MLRLRAVALAMLLGLGLACGDDDGQQSDEAREAAVLAAVILDVADAMPVDEEDPDPADRSVFVEPLDEESAFGLEVQAGVVLQLADLVDVTFIDDRDAAVEEDENGMPVRGGAALIAVGPVPAGGPRAVVVVERYEREGAEERLRYVVARVGESWVVAERGPVG